MRIFDWRLKILGAANSTVPGFDRRSASAGRPPSGAPFEADVRLRYRGEEVPAAVEVTGGEATVEFRTPQRGVAPGQSVVLYRGDEVLGGGRIREAVR